MRCFVSIPFCLLISTLVWILPEEDHEAKIQVKIVYLGSTGNIRSEVRKGSREGKEAKKLATTVSHRSLIQRGNSETRRKTRA